MSTVVARCVGLFCIVTALMKVGATPPPWFLASVPLPRSAWQLAVATELALGLTILLGDFTKLVKYLALAYFAVMACVAAMLALAGHSSCGCLGQISFRPEFAATIDL